MHSAPDPRATSRAEIVWWFLRLSGLALVVLAGLHLYAMHYATAPANTDSAFVARRWSSAGWRTFDAFLLLLAVTHGLAGLETIVRDALHTSRARAVADVVFVLLSLAAIALGATTLAAVTHASFVDGPLDGAIWIAAALHSGLVVIATITYAALLVLAVALGLQLFRRKPIGWWSFSGQWAFALHRATGLGILAFLAIHLIDIALAPFAPRVYDATVASYADPYLVPMEIALVAAVLYHGINGIRLIVMEIADRRMLPWRSTAFSLVIVITLVLLAPSVVVLVRSLP